MNDCSSKQKQVFFYPTALLYIFSLKLMLLLNFLIFLFSVYLFFSLLSESIYQNLLLLLFLFLTRKVCMFSATYNQEILDLANSVMRVPNLVNVGTKNSAASHVHQKLVYAGMTPFFFFFVALFHLQTSFLFLFFGIKYEG